jgi:hypothetical protein
MLKVNNFPIVERETGFELQPKSITTISDQSRDQGEEGVVKGASWGSAKPNCCEGAY